MVIGRFTTTIFCLFVYWQGLTLKHYLELARWPRLARDLWLASWLSLSDYEITSLHHTPKLVKSSWWEKHVTKVCHPNENASENVLSIHCELIHTKKHPAHTQGTANQTVAQRVTHWASCCCRAPVGWLQTAWNRQDPCVYSAFCKSTFSRLLLCFT